MHNLLAPPLKEALGMHFCNPTSVSSVNHLLNTPGQCWLISQSFTPGQVKPVALIPRNFDVAAFHFVT